MATETVKPAPRRLSARNRWLQSVVEFFIESSLLMSAMLSIVVTFAIAGVVCYGAGEFFLYKDAPGGSKLEPMTAGEIYDRVTQFFTATEWTPGFQNPRYGIAPLVIGTLMVTLIAALIALPMGLIIAIYLSEYAKPRVRAFAKPTLELLAGIPTVVYGFFALTMVTPFLSIFFEANLQELLAQPDSGVWFGLVSSLHHWGLLPWFNGRLGDPNNQLSGGVVVGIMVIPMVASLSEDALRAVPLSLRHGAIALGANKFETSVYVVVPAALSGVIASFILAISRAVGETMAVSLACGETPRFPSNPAESLTTGLATMTSFIVGRAKGDAVHGNTDYNSIFAVAGMLFFMTLFMNMVAQMILKRYRQVYQ